MPRRFSHGSPPATGSLPWREQGLTPAEGSPIQDADRTATASPDSAPPPGRVARIRRSRSAPDAAPESPDLSAATSAAPIDPEATTTLPSTLRRSRRAERTNSRPTGPEPDSEQPQDDQEPTVDHGRAGRNLPAAIAVGVGLAALALVSLFTRPEAFVVLASLVVVLAVWELSGALAAKQVVVPVVPVAVGSIGMLVSAYVAGAQGLVVSFALTGLGILLWRVIDGVDGALRDVSAGLFAAAYVPLLAGFAVLLLADDDGPQRVVTFILVTVASDIGGYIAGVIAGKHPMAPTISPKKSWEGFAGSVFFCLVAGAASVILLLDGRWWVGLVLGAAAAVTATLGDLSESLLKRDLKIKDMGNLLPGHGGIMDRLDSLLPTAPVAYLVLHFLIK